MKQSLQATLTSILLGLMIVALLSYSGWDEWFASEPSQTGEEAQPDLVALLVDQTSFDEQGNKQYQGNVVCRPCKNGQMEKDNP